MEESPKAWPPAGWSSIAVDLGVGVETVQSHAKVARHKFRAPSVMAAVETVRSVLARMA